MVGDPLALSEEPGESEERAGVPLPLSTFDVRPAEDGCGGAEWVSLGLVSTPSLASMWAKNQGKANFRDRPRKGGQRHGEAGETDRKCDQQGLRESFRPHPQLRRKTTTTVPDATFSLPSDQDEVC